MPWQQSVIKELSFAQGSCFQRSLCFRALQISIDALRRE